MRRDAEGLGRINGSRSGRQRVFARGILVLGALMAAPFTPTGPAFASTQSPPTTSAESSPRTLEQELRALQAAGHPIFFSSAIVRPSMKVTGAPPPGPLSARLDALLRPHGLSFVEGPKGRIIVVEAPVERPDAERAERPATVAREEIFVTASRAESRHGEPVEAAALEATSVAAGLPRPANDVLQAVGQLPSATTAESSSRLSVRGGRQDEVMVVLDGLELLAPYHLREFDDALAIVSGETLDRVELIRDPFPAEYGDRLGAVLDMRSRAAEGPLDLRLGVGSFFAEGLASGLLGDRGRWLGSVRTGTYEMALEADGRDEKPRYWDLFGRIDHSLSGSQSLGLHLLAAEDVLDVTGHPVGGGAYESLWRSSYAWLNHVASFGTDLVAESQVSIGRLDRSRKSDRAVQGTVEFDLEDSRQLELVGGKSVWRFAPSDSLWAFDGGVEIRQLRWSVDYRAERDALPSSPIVPTPPRSTTRFDGLFDFDDGGAFASARLRTSALSAEAGLRYDEIGLSDESHLSPRTHLAWRPREMDLVRAAWGLFYQSQRPYELQVEDGERKFWPAERAEHRMLSWEHRTPRGASWRIGGFERILTRPRARYESLFDQSLLYPELDLGRIRLEPDRGRAFGFELGLRGPASPRGAWSAAYTWSSVADRVDGRWLPRATDETHAIELQTQVHLPREWTVSAVWQFHTGWPTTAVGARLIPGEAGEGRIEPMLGPFRGERLPPYHRLDLRLSRAWRLPIGSLDAYVDAQNVYDRDNLRGYQGFSFALGPDGEPQARGDAVSWGDLLPSFGLRWSR